MYCSHLEKWEQEQQLKPVPELKTVSVAEPIISESFFFLTSSNFSRDRSKGFIPTIYTDSKVAKKKHRT